MFLQNLIKNWKAISSTAPEMEKPLKMKVFRLFYRYEAKMRQTEERMRALGLLTPSCVLTLDEWEIPRDRVVINRKLGEGAFGTVYGGEAFFDEKGWVSTIIFQSLERRD